MFRAALFTDATSANDTASYNNTVKNIRLGQGALKLLEDKTWHWLEHRCIINWWMFDKHVSIAAFEPGQFCTIPSKTLQRFRALYYRPDVVKSIMRKCTHMTPLEYETHTCSIQLLGLNHLLLPYIFNYKCVYQNFPKYSLFTLFHFNINLNWQ